MNKMIKNQNYFIFSRQEPHQGLTSIQMLGFTLIELVVVLALLSIAAVIVFSSIETSPESKFNNVLREITQNITLAKFCAISRNMNYVVAFDIPNNQYFVLEDPDFDFRITNFDPPAPPCPFYPGVCNYTGGTTLVGNDNLIFCKRIDEGVAGGVNVSGMGIGFIATASIGSPPPFPYQNIDVSSVCPDCVNGRVAFIFSPDGRAYVNSSSNVGRIENGGSAVLVSMNHPKGMGMITKAIMVRTPKGDVKIFPR